jgi:hypothetical protein
MNRYRKDVVATLVVVVLAGIGVAVTQALMALV